MTSGTRFGKKLRIPATFQLKHQFLIWRLKNQLAKEAAEPDARVVPHGIGQEAPDLSIAVGRNSADLGNFFVRRDFLGILLQVCDDCLDGHEILVEGWKVELPTTLAIPLGFIVNELITNSAKYAPGQVIVEIKATSAGHHSLSVVDDGPGLPAGFDPAANIGLGMKIVLALVKQIGGEFGIWPGKNGRGTRFTVTF